jgi:hypothetical protein
MDELELQFQFIHDTSRQNIGVTSCCKYSQVLLMMGENFARNM